MSYGDAQRQVLLAACHACGTQLENVRDEDGLPIVFAIVAWPYGKPDRSVLMSGSLPGKGKDPSTREQVIEALEEALRDARGTFVQTLRPT